MSNLKELTRGYESRRIVFREIKNKDTILAIGKTKFYALVAKVNRLKKVKEDVDIIYLMTCSKNELRGHAL